MERVRKRVRKGWGRRVERCTYSEIACCQIRYYGCAQCCEAMVIDDRLRHNRLQLVEHTKTEERVNGGLAGSWNIWCSAQYVALEVWGSHNANMQQCQRR